MFVIIIMCDVILTLTVAGLQQVNVKLAHISGVGFWPDYIVVEIYRFWQTVEDKQTTGWPLLSPCRIANKLLYMFVWQSNNEVL